MEDNQYKYVYGIGKTALDIPESEIRYAMENTKSNAEAARFLKVSFTTYKNMLVYIQIEILVKPYTNFIKISLE